MSEDYLWNKTGEPDPDVKELEEILGVLKYQPRPLVLPEDLQVPQRRRSYFSLLAIAATIALAVIAAGLWFSLKSTKAPAKSITENTPSVPASSPASVPNNNPVVAVDSNKDKKPEPTPNRKTRRTVVTNQALIAKRQREREEALAAKDQLLIALRLASEKLSQAQRRTQLPSIPNQNRNQHKVG